jgi:hypothetical protein
MVGHELHQLAFALRDSDSTTTIRFSLVAAADLDSATTTADLFSDRLSAVIAILSGVTLSDPRARR